PPHRLRRPGLHHHLRHRGRPEDHRPDVPRRHPRALRQVHRRRRRRHGRHDVAPPLHARDLLLLPPQPPRLPQRRRRSHRPHRPRPRLRRHPRRLRRLHRPRRRLLPHRLGRRAHVPLLLLLLRRRLLAHGRP